MISNEQTATAYQSRQRRAQGETQTPPKELLKIFREVDEERRIEKEKLLRLPAEERSKEENRRKGQLMAELEEMTKDLPKPEFDWEEWEKECREEDEYERGVPMYDWGARQPSNQHEIKKKYGSKIAFTLWDCHFHAEDVPRKLVHQMHLIHEGKQPRPTGKPVQVVQPAKAPQAEKTSKVKWEELGKGKPLSPKEYANDHFSRVKAGFFNLARVNDDLKNPTTLLFYLQLHRPWEGKKDKHDTYNTWYLKKKLIVASVSEKKMSADLGVHKKTIRNWTKALHECGVIRKIKVGLENVYVLGEVIDGKELFYYSGEITWKPRSGSVH